MIKIKKLNDEELRKQINECQIVYCIYQCFGIASVILYYFQENIVLLFLALYFIIMSILAALFGKIDVFRLELRKNDK